MEKHKSKILQHLTRAHLILCLKKDDPVKATKGSQKPIQSDYFWDRFQVDLIDMRKLRTRDPFGVLINGTSHWRIMPPACSILVLSQGRWSTVQASSYLWCYWFSKDIPHWQRKGVYNQDCAWNPLNDEPQHFISHEMSPPCLKCLLLLNDEYFTKASAVEKEHGC